MRGVQADDLERVFGGSRGADAPMGFGGTGTPKRSWPKQARRKRIILTSRHFLSPLDTGPSRRLPEGLRPAAEVHGPPPPARGSRLRRHAALAHGGGGAGGTASGPRAASRRGTSRPDASRKGAVCGLRVAQNALFRYITAREAWGATPRQPAGHYGEWPNWANVLAQPPARLAGGCARVRRPRPGARRLTEKRSLAEGLADGAPCVRPQAAQASP